MESRFWRMASRRLSMPCLRTMSSPGVDQARPGRVGRIEHQRGEPWFVHDHRVKLDELHIPQVQAGLGRQEVALAHGRFLVVIASVDRPPAAGGQYDGRRHKAAVLAAAVKAPDADDPVCLPQQGRDVKACQERHARERPEVIRQDLNHGNPPDDIRSGWHDGIVITAFDQFQPRERRNRIAAAPSRATV